MDRAPGLRAKSEDWGSGGRCSRDAGVGGRGDSSNRNCLAPSERARPRSGFNVGPRSAPRGHRLQRTAPGTSTPTHIQAPSRLVWAWPCWGVCVFRDLAGKVPVSDEDPARL